MNKKGITLTAAILLAFAVSSTAAASPGTVERSVNFRSAPSTSSTVYSQLSTGTSVDVMEKVNDYWLKISVGGKVGYVSPSYITYTAIPASTGSSGTVERSVNFRSAPSTSGSVYSMLSAGTSVEVLEKVNDYWLKISVGGKIGYVSSSYITYTAVSTPAPAPVESASETAARVIERARSLTGITHYEYGVNQAPSLMDCSAFTKYVFGQEGISLKWGTFNQKDAGTYVSRSNLKPGDLVFFRVGSSTSIGHVGIYMGNGQMIHNSPSADGVQIISITSGYWEDRYVTARRVL
jgi:cell wall-associated NlpC family hydrolase